MDIGVLHPGDMGAAIGRILVEAGHSVRWSAADRSPATAERAAAAGLIPVDDARELAAASALLISVCPPHAAVDVAASVAGFAGIYLDANAISPETARRVAAIVPAAAFVDGGIIGPPPTEPGVAKLFLSGRDPSAVPALFTNSALATEVISDGIGAASALKLAYAAWSKATKALLLSVRAAAAREGVEEVLAREWARSAPEVPAYLAVSVRSARTKGWRWVGEMEEVADLWAACGLPDGFHRAAAEIFRRSPDALTEVPGGPDAGTDKG